MNGAIAEARRYLRRQRHGVLSTISKKLGGYPFGSVTAGVTDHAARPVLLISRLAEHTRNIEADPRDYCRHFKQRQPKTVTMTAIDCDGFDLRADGEFMRFAFEQPVVDAHMARAALVAMASQARA